MADIFGEEKKQTPLSHTQRKVIKTLMENKGSYLEPYKQNNPKAARRFCLKTVDGITLIPQLKRMVIDNLLSKNRIKRMVNFTLGAEGGTDPRFVYWLADWVRMGLKTPLVEGEGMTETLDKVVADHLSHSSSMVLRDSENEWNESCGEKDPVSMVGEFLEKEGEQRLPVSMINEQEPLPVWAHHIITADGSDIWIHEEALQQMAKDKGVDPEEVIKELKEGNIVDHLGPMPHTGRHTFGAPAADPNSHTIKVHPDMLKDSPNPLDPRSYLEELPTTGRWLGGHAIIPCIPDSWGKDWGVQNKTEGDAIAAIEKYRNTPIQFYDSGIPVDNPVARSLVGDELGKNGGFTESDMESWKEWWGAAWKREFVQAMNRINPKSQSEISMAANLQKARTDLGV